jgi:hypothetical protein
MNKPTVIVNGPEKIQVFDFESEKIRDQWIVDFRTALNRVFWAKGTINDDGKFNVDCDAAGFQFKKLIDNGKLIESVTYKPKKNHPVLSY